MKKDVMVIRESIGRVVSMLTLQAIKVTQRGSNAYVKYHSKTGAVTELNIPYIPDDASDDFIAAIQGFLDHEVGHVLYSDSKVLLIAVKEGKRVMNLANIVEDVFVERKMTEGFRGSGTNLESVRKFYLEKIARPKIKAALAAGDLEQARGYAIVIGFRAWGGQSSSIDFLKDSVMADLVKPIFEKLGSEIIEKLANCKNSMDCLALARECKTKLETPKPPPPPPPPEVKDFLDKIKDTDLAEAISKGEEKEPAEDEGTERVEDDDSGKTGSEKAPAVDGGTDEDGTSLGDHSEGADDTEEAVDEKPTSPDDTEFDPAAPPAEPDPLAGLLDTECDFDKDVSEGLSKDAKKALEGSDYAVFSTEFDKIIPAPLCVDKNAITRMEDGIRDKIGVMQKSLERAMAAKARKAWNPGQRRGRIAPGSLFKTSVGDDRVFRQRFETKAPSTAVSLVIDCSGSMGGSKIQLAGIAAYGLSVVLERLKVNYEVIGFTSLYSGEMGSLITEDAKSHGMRAYDMNWGRIEPIHMPVFKPFSGKLDTAAISRMAHLTESPRWLSQNIDGESVQLAARRLVQQKAERHVMIVLSDGQPACAAGQGLEEHLTKTVKALEKQNVEMIGIGIMDESVKQFYPKHVVLNDVAELPTRVMAELTKLLLA